jgi:hypothetical protein
MSIIRKLIRYFKRLIRRLDLDDIPPVSLLFFGGCFVLAVILFFSWRGDTDLLLNGREIQADVIDRRIEFNQDCDDYGCTNETSYFLTYTYIVDDESYTDEKSVDSGIYDRAESRILVRYLPDRPDISNVAETVENTLPFPFVSVVFIIIGLIGAVVVYFIS